MFATQLPALDLFTPAAAGLSMNLIAVIGIAGAVILGVVWMALRGSSGGSD